MSPCNLLLHQETLSYCTILCFIFQETLFMLLILRFFAPMLFTQSRDTVRSHPIQLKDVIECFLAREWTIFLSSNDDNFHAEDTSDSSGQNGDLERIRNNFQHQQQHNERHHETIMSLALLHRESRKSRPMTCAPHTVSMENILVL